MRVLFLADEEGRLLGYSANEKHIDGVPCLTLGTYRPVVDGNYYNHICVFFDVAGNRNESWWQWVTESLSDNMIQMDDEFAFDIEDMRWIEGKIEGI